MKFILKFLMTKNLKTNKNIEFLKSRKIFDQEYFKLKKNIKKWSNFYDSFKKPLNHTKEF